MLNFTDSIRPRVIPGPGTERECAPRFSRVFALCVFLSPHPFVNMGGEQQVDRGYILTNNPLVVEKLGPGAPVEYLECSYKAVLEAARDRIHQGAKLLSHPLSGSVKPGETPYKSVILVNGKGDVDEQSLALIENAILACAKFQQRCDRYRPAVDLDCRLIDWTLLESALASVIV